VRPRRTASSHPIFATSGGWVRTPTLGVSFATRPRRGGASCPGHLLCTPTLALNGCPLNSPWEEFILIFQPVEGSETSPGGGPSVTTAWQVTVSLGAHAGRWLRGRFQCS